MNFEKEKERERRGELILLNPFKFCFILFLLKIQIHTSFDGITD